MSSSGKKVVTLTFGCQMSERDAETLAEISIREGYSRILDISKADLIIVNTCCVRESAENKIVGKIGELKKLKDKNPLLKIAVSGCMVQQAGALDKLKKRAPHIDIWLGTHNHQDFPRLLQEAHANNKVAEVLAKPAEIMDDISLAEKGKLRANVNIIHGCNNFCTYCIVPHVRGREHSRKPEIILSEIRQLVNSGCREISLLGQNVNSYGQEFAPAFHFSDLLREIDHIDGLWRVRFITSHPKDLSDQLIQTVAQGKILCEHFHLPIQSGSDKILGWMNRKYTVDFYKNRVETIRRHLPHASITSDIIVGFPGETEDDFQQTLDLIETMNYSNVFTFIFSKRSGTPAATMPDQVPLDVKKRRLQKLMKLQNEKSLAWRQQMVGKTVEVLVEGPSKTNPDRLTGRTRGNELVVFPGSPLFISTLQQVTIVEAGPWTMLGEINPF